MPLITREDLAPFADIDPVKADAMIADAIALAARVAPCILDDSFAHTDAAKAILRAAILRWNDAGSGVVTQQVAGPFQQTVDSRQQRRAMFWPAEIADLQGLCDTDASSGDAFEIDTVGGVPLRHADMCAVRFGADYCSCGAVLTGEVPLYEQP